MKAHLRSFAIGLFYGAFMLVLDRCLHVKGASNVILMVVFAIAALLLTIGTIKVPKESRFHMPLKPFSILFGFILSVAALYAFLGNMHGKQNFVQGFAEGKPLPPAAQKYLDKYVDWASRHSLIGNEPAPAEKTPGKP